MTNGFQQTTTEHRIIGEFLAGRHPEKNDVVHHTDLDVFFDNGIKVRKYCENCGKEFIVKWSNRERSFCCINCYDTYEKKIQKLNKMNIERYLKNKENIYQLFVNLENRLNRTPKLFELVEECSNQKVSLTIHSEKDENSGYFRKYDDIIKFVEERELNFKVVKIEEVGFEDVYNGTVDDNHNFYVYTGEDLGKNGKPRMNFIKKSTIIHAKLFRII